MFLLFVRANNIWLILLNNWPTLCRWSRVWFWCCEVGFILCLAGSKPIHIMLMIMRIRPSLVLLCLHLFISPFCCSTPAFVLRNTQNAWLGKVIHTSDFLRLLSNINFVWKNYLLDKTITDRSYNSKSRWFCFWILHVSFTFTMRMLWCFF